jgi:multidrug transporter EmrE-like cation transporter
MEDWIIGMVLVFVGCCCSAVGLILLKHSTNVEEHLPLHRRPFWAVGVVFLIVNASVIDVIAFSLAPLTLVAPFSGVTIVLTTWLASSGMLFVKETVDTHDMISTALALVGVTITTSFGPHIDDAKGANELSACFGQTDVHIFAAVSMGIFGASWLTYFAHRRLRQATWFRICVYAYTAALAGSASMLLLKVVGLVFCAIVQLGFLHRTLANSPVSYGVPTYQTLLTVLTIIAGGFFFDEFSVMPPKDVVWFSFGVAVSLGGVAMHSLHRATVDTDDKGQGLPTVSPRGTDTGTLQERRGGAAQADETALTPGRLSRSSISGSSTERSSLISASPSSLGSPGL